MSMGGVVVALADISPTLACRSPELSKNQKNKIKITSKNIFKQKKLKKFNKIKHKQTLWESNYRKY